MNIIRRYTFGIKEYCHVKLDDGRRVELAGRIGLYPDDGAWLAYASVWRNAQVDTPVDIPPLARFSDAEVLRRGLNIAKEA